MTPRPNILWVFTDQQRFDTIQAAGSSFDAKTPNMDFLAREGIVFENAFCTAPVCSPSRASMMTGLYPHQVGMPGNLYAPSPPMSPTIPTVGNYFRSAGYETIYHGKWHLGGGDVRRYGFEHGEESSDDQATRLLAARRWRDRDWIEHERPFLHVVSFLNPHDLYFYDPAQRASGGAPGAQRPWKNLGSNDASIPEPARSKKVDWPEEQWGSYTRFYNEQIERVDRDLGELLHQFRCSGFYNNSWIIFCADHGDMAGEHDLPFKGPYMYEGVVRVPLIIVPPMTRFMGADRADAFAHDLQPGKRQALCSLIDLLPTMMDIADIPKPDHLPGTSLMPVIRGAQEEVRDSVFAQWYPPSVQMVRDRHHKLVRYPGHGEELYDLQQDPHETLNLAAAESHAAIKSSLRDRLDRHLRETADA